MKQTLKSWLKFAFELLLEILVDLSCLDQDSHIIAL